MMSSADGVIVNLARELPSISVLVYVLSFLAGVIMFAWGIQTARLAHETAGRRATNRQAIYIIVAAVMLINASLAIGIWSETLLGTQQEPAQLLDYSMNGGGAGEFTKTTLEAILAFVQFVGLLAFARGWFILSRIGERQDATLGKALTHVIGGVLAVNIVTTAKITAWTFGLAVLYTYLDTI